MTFKVGKTVSRRGWWVQETYGLQRAWGPYLTRWGARRVARKLKRRTQTETELI